MKLSTFILTASVALAIVVPAAQAQIPRDEGVIPPVRVTQASTPSGAHLKNLLLAKKQAAKIRALGAKNNALLARNTGLAEQVASLQALVIKYMPVVIGPPLVPDANACIDYVTDCTPEQNCTLWGFGCNYLVTPVESTSKNESSAAAPAAETAAADSSANSTQNTNSQATSRISSLLTCGTLADPALSNENPLDYNWDC